MEVITVSFFLGPVRLSLPDLFCTVNWSACSHSFLFPINCPFWGTGTVSSLRCVHTSLSCPRSPRRELISWDVAEAFSRLAACPSSCSDSLCYLCPATRRPQLTRRSLLTPLWRFISRHTRHVVSTSVLSQDRLFPLWFTKLPFMFKTSSPSAVKSQKAPHEIFPTAGVNWEFGGQHGTWSHFIWSKTGFEAPLNPSPNL